MEYLMTLRPGFREEVLEQYNLIKDCTDEELIDSYNLRVEIGIVEVYKQATHLLAMRLLFKERFDYSPIVIKDQVVISLSGKVTVQDLYKIKNREPQYCDQYRKELDSFSEEELVDAFNEKVSSAMRNEGHIEYLKVVRDSLANLGIDVSAIGDVSEMNYIHLLDKEVKRVKDLPLNEIQKILDQWARLCRPGIVKDKPQVAEVYPRGSLRVRSGIPGYGIQMELPIKDMIMGIIEWKRK